jgi:hypothetical protein
MDFLLFELASEQPVLRSLELVLRQLSLAPPLVLGLPERLSVVLLEVLGELEELAPLASALEVKSVDLVVGLVACKYFLFVG